jgi:peptidoglycan/LPS O-acetylase OafA/YrhL
VYCVSSRSTTACSPSPSSSCRSPPGISPLDYQHQLWLWIYLSNWASPVGLGVAALTHFWSLAVEEQFYLMWPLVVRAFAPRRLTAVCVLLIVVALASRIVARAIGATPHVPYQNTLCRADALAMGAIAACALRVPALAPRLAVRQRALVVGTIALFVAGGAVTHGYPRDGVATQTIGYSILAWSALVALVLGVLMQARGGRLAVLLAPAPLHSVGKYSYAMYIFHAPIHHELGVPLLARLGQTQPTVGVTLVYCIVMTAVTYAVALVSYHLLERRFLRLKRRFPVASAA